MKIIKSKKGAMELSVNTIVVIVIGVTLLVLGLVFVKGIFDRLGDQADVIFGNVENELSSIATHDQKLTVQNSVPVKQGDQSFFKIWVVNLDDSPKTFKISVEPSSGNPFGERVDIDFASNEEYLDIGEEAGFVAGVATTENAPLKAGGYKITVLANNQPYDTAGFFVKVEK
ncbi:MAG: hypothetical protein KKG60_00645 [Nanoarchaeota archaeon]|nr:hypothetical protein [Nanoarchaeota archaeon]